MDRWSGFFQGIAGANMSSFEPDREPVVAPVAIELACMMSRAKETIQVGGSIGLASVRQLELLVAIGAHQLWLADEVRAIRQRMNYLESLEELEADLPTKPASEGEQREVVR